uniref:Peptidase A1 domain-containing protein n=1 Tax=Triticum aestivum TaxID=4565 RepID=A0A3B6IYF0_WHEAT
MLDTGSDLVWTQCFCQVCFPQPFPELDTSASGTARGVSCFDPLCAQGGLSLSGCAVSDNSCIYTDSYGDNSVTTAKLYEDTFTFQQAPNGKAVVVPNLRFGCSMFNTGMFGSNESGIAGFGRGAPSPAFLGTPDNLQAQATGRLQSTPLVRNPESNHYYLSLKGITVGKTRLPFDASAFTLKGDGSGGTIIDSGLALTSVPEAVYRSLVEEFESQVPLPVNKNNTDEHEGLLCFTASPKKKETAMPKLILHLEGADWDLQRENYVLYTEEDGLCVVISSAGEDSRSLIGNFQQQNTHIVYDLEHNMLVFVPARCDKL